MEQEDLKKSNYSQRSSKNEATSWNRTQKAQILRGRPCHQANDHNFLLATKK